MDEITQEFTFDSKIYRFITAAHTATDIHNSQPAQPSLLSRFSSMPSAAMMQALIWKLSIIDWHYRGIHEACCIAIENGLCADVSNHEDLE